MLRPRRKGASNAPPPSSIYYLGYVEENESPASIMKKFEELERIQQQNPQAPDQTLTETQMEELFQKTSSFSLETLVDTLYECDEEFLFLDELGNGEDEDEGRIIRTEYLSPQEDLLDLSENDDREIVSKRVGMRRAKVSMDSANVNISLLLKSGRLKRVTNDSVVTTTRLPTPIPHSLANLITDTRNIICPIYRYDEFVNYAPFSRDQISAVIVNFSDWALTSNLSVDQFINQGFLLIWTRKQHIPRTVEFAHKFGFKYCESICWIKMDFRHKLYVEPSAIVNECKETLFVFRRFKDAEMELKHQRSADCVFDFVKPLGTNAKPSAVYRIIDTLIPVDSTGQLNDECPPHEKISFVELSDGLHRPVGVSKRWCKVVFGH